MKSYFIIQDKNTNEYFYGFYSDKSWTNKVEEARSFFCSEEAEQFIENENTCTSIYSIIKVYSKG